MKNFLDFYLSKGAPLVREVGYIPLTDSEQELVRKRFADRRTGTMFTGTDSHSQVTLEQRLTK